MEGRRNKGEDSVAKFMKEKNQDTLKKRCHEVNNFCPQEEPNHICSCCLRLLVRTCFCQTQFVPFGIIRQHWQEAKEIKKKLALPPPPDPFLLPPIYPLVRDRRRSPPPFFSPPSSPWFSKWPLLIDSVSKNRGKRERARVANTQPAKCATCVFTCSSRQVILESECNELLLLCQTSLKSGFFF